MLPPHTYPPSKVKIYCHDDVLNNVGCLSPRNCICQRRVSSLFPFVPSRLLAGEGMFFTRKENVMFALYVTGGNWKISFNLQESKTPSCREVVMYSLNSANRLGNLVKTIKVLLLDLTSCQHCFLTSCICFGSEHCSAVVVSHTVLRVVVSTSRVSAMRQ